MMFLPKLVLFFVFIASSQSLNILGIFPIPGRGHFSVFEPLMKALATKGHEVTVISNFPQAKPLPNYRDIVLKSETIFLNLSDAKSPVSSKFLTPMFLSTVTNCEKLSEKPVLDLINSDEKFDLVIAELFNTECFLGFVHKFKAHLIAISSNTIMPWYFDRYALPDNPSYIPQSLMKTSNHMNFWERLENAVLNVHVKVSYKFLMDIPGNRIARKYFGEDLPPLIEISENCSLVLINTHPSFYWPAPIVPSVIQVGGIHIGKNKSLPQNIEKWIKESPHGVIYFSMGSMIKGDTFPEEKRRAFLRAFGRLQQRVLWKWENDTMPEKPDNVMIQKWMPQFDILCHPNVKAFISHGGLLGTTEAVHCGVPTIVMPQYGDQFTNARALEASGGGIILDFSTATEEDVYNALRTALEPSFNKKTKELSERFRDRPMSPLDTAVYWVEYVARHKGAHHLKTAAVGMPLYQYLLLDVIAFLAVVVIAISYISFYITRAIFRKLFKKQSKVKKN